MIFGIKAPGDASTESTYNTPKVSEEVKRGGVSVQKLDAQTGSKPQGGASFEGITFSIINNGDNDVMVDGVSYAKGQVVKTITTDAKGFASTTGDCLPFGKYIIRETSGNGGYLVTAPDIHATVSEDGKIYSFTAKDEIARGGVKVSKRDLESGLPTSLGAANLDGTRFEVKSLKLDRKAIEALLADNPEIASRLIRSSAEITPKDSYGEADLDFTFDAAEMAGKDAVVFELLMKDGYAVAAHADITDENQTVSLFEPEIGTTAKDGVDGDHHAVIDPEAVIVDTISYKDLIPGKEYTVKGTLMVKSTGEPLLGEDGKPVTAETTFTPDHDHGTVDVTFEFDGSSLKGDSVVVFETLYRDGKEITAHADIDDEGQTVEFTEPSLGTTAEDGIDGDQSLVADGKAVIVDNVSYKGLVPGKEYKVVGTLMLKDIGEPLLDADGKSVTAEATFTPDHDHGTVDVTFTFDASLLAGQQVVAFETLYRLDKEITAHADIEDENQTIEVIQPGVDTVAVDGFDGDKDVVADPEAKITDTLSYLSPSYRSMSRA